MHKARRIDIGISMSPKSRYLEVEHEVIVEEDPPYFLGDELHVRVKVRNLKAEPVKRSFCYALQYPGGMVPRTMEFDLGPNEEKVHKLYDNKPPYYLGFMGIFQIILLKEETRFSPNESTIAYNALFAGNVKDRDGYELQERTAKAVEMMTRVGNNTLYLTIAIAVLAAVEILTLVLGSV